MKTRHTTNGDPGHAPERHLSDPGRRPVTVSLAIAAQATRDYIEPHRRAALWLANLAANSQRIQLCWQRRGLPDPLGTVGQIAEARLAARLGMEPAEIYRALTGHPQADLPRFTRAVEQFRAAFEREIPKLVETDDTATIADAFDCAQRQHKVAVIEGKWRHGKTEECEVVWLRNLDRAVWIHTPSDATERTFLNAMGDALGIGVGSGKKPAQLRQQIKGALGIGLIELLVIDEAHYLWPANVADAKPVRAELVRELRDTLGVGAVLITTEQFALALSMAVTRNQRWAPGQLLGRRERFTLRDTHTDAEIGAIARMHGGPVLTGAAVAALVEFAKSEEGYLGAMVNVIQRAIRRTAGNVTGADVVRAIESQRRDEKIERMAEVTTLPRRRMNGTRSLLGRRSPSLALPGRGAQ